ncbi:unnamed protein product [Mucor fragilis]
MTKVFLDIPITLPHTTEQDAMIKFRQNSILSPQRTFVQQESSIKLYKLSSVSLIRKYIGVFDLMISNDRKSIEMISPPFAYLTTHKAMRQHSSQLVWFRWLYVTFSRYMFINDLMIEKQEDL